jgi:lycopene beta-cyclase
MGSALFANENFRRDLDLQPYHYNMVKGLDFTTSIWFAFETSITFINQKVLEIEESETIILVQTERILFLNYSTVFTQTQSRKPNISCFTTAFYRLVYQKWASCIQYGASHVYGFSVEQKEIPFYTCCPQKPSITEYTLFSHQHLKKGRMKWN